MEGRGPCGDDDDGSTSDGPRDTPEAADDRAAGADDGSDGTASDATASGSGTVTVDGTYRVAEALSCETDEQIVDGMDRDAEAQFFGSVDGARFQLDVYITKLMGNESHDVSWAGPEGIFGTGVIAVGGSWVGDGDETYTEGPIHLDGNRATGSATNQLSHGGFVRRGRS